MKILHSQVMAGVAGSENVLLRLLPALRARGHEVHFLAIHAAENLATCRDFCASLAAHGVSTNVLVHRRLPDLQLFKQLDRIVGAGGYDLVHTHLIKTDAMFAAARLLYGRHYRLVSTKHGYRERLMERHGLDPREMSRDAFWLAAKAAEHQVTASSAVSSGVARLFCGVGISDPDRMHVTYLGFDYPESPTSGLEALRFGEPQLCQVGRLVDCKGQDVAIQTAARLLPEFPGLALVLVGGGPRDAELRALAASLGVDRHVHFVGRQEDPARFVAASDVALVPSKAEGFGLVILEAMAVGRPVVAFDVPAPNEVIRHGLTGLLAPAGGVEAYADLVAQLLRHPAQRIDIAAAARADLKKRFSLSAMVDGFERFYGLALATEPRRTWRL